MDLTIFGIRGTDIGSNVIFGSGQNNFLGGVKFLRKLDVHRWNEQTRKTIYDDIQVIENGRLRYYHAYWITKSTSTDEMRFFTTPGILINNAVTLSDYSTMTIKFQMSSAPSTSSNLGMYWYRKKPTVQWYGSKWGSIDPGEVGCIDPVDTYYSSAGTFTATFSTSKYPRTDGWWVLTIPYNCKDNGISANSVSTWLDYLWLW